MKSANLKVLKFVFITFLGWKIVLLSIAFIGLSVFPVSLPENQTTWADVNIDFWGRWANWDGGHFRGIAEVGYLPFQAVFFPLYPLLMKGFMLLRVHSLWAGIIISNLAIVGALFYLYKLIRLDFDEGISKKAIFFTLAFPTAFYFNAVYSEALFLFLTITAFYYSRKERWFYAFLLAGLAGATRLTGLVVIAAIALEYFIKASNPPALKQFWSEFLNRIAVYLLVIAFFCSLLQKYFLGNKVYLEAEVFKLFSYLLTFLSFLLVSVFFFKYLLKFLDFKKVFSKVSLFVVLSFLPFLGYCYFLYTTQGSFFAFIAHEKEWDRYLTLPWNSVIVYLQNIWGNGFFRVGHTHQFLIELLFFIFFLTLLIFSYFKLRLSYTFYFAVSLLIPLSTGTLQAIHRYGLVIFPVFILLALIKNETYSSIWIYISVTLLGVFTVLFINYYWVS